MKGINVLPALEKPNNIRTDIFKKLILNAYLHIYISVVEITASQKAPKICKYEFMKYKQTDTVSDTTHALTSFTDPKYVMSLRQSNYNYWPIIMITIEFILIK
jgi:hypothetical protein